MPMAVVEAFSAILRKVCGGGFTVTSLGCDEFLYFSLALVYSVDSIFCARISKVFRGSPMQKSPSCQVGLRVSAHTIFVDKARGF